MCGHQHQQDGVGRVERGAEERELAPRHVEEEGGLAAHPDDGQQHEEGDEHPPDDPAAREEAAFALDRVEPAALAVFGHRRKHLFGRFEDAEGGFRNERHG